MGVPFRWILHVGITGSYDATVRVWDLKSRSFEPIQVIDDARDSVTSLQVTDYEILTGSVLQYFFGVMTLRGLGQLTAMFEIMIFVWESCIKIALEVKREYLDYLAF